VKKIVKKSYKQSWVFPTKKSSKTAAIMVDLQKNRGKGGGGLGPLH